jgi:hypothetical protein
MMTMLADCSWHLPTPRRINYLLEEFPNQCRPTIQQFQSPEPEQRRVSIEEHDEEMRDDNGAQVEFGSNDSLHTPRDLFGSNFDDLLYFLSGNDLSVEISRDSSKTEEAKDKRRDNILCLQWSCRQNNIGTARNAHLA